MKIKNNSDKDIKGFSFEGVEYSLLAGESKSVEEGAAEYLCKVFGFVSVDEATQVAPRETPEKEDEAPTAEVKEEELKDEEKVEEVLEP